MAKKVLYTDFTDTETVIKTLLESTEIKRAMKRKNLFDMWEKVVGKSFSEKSKPYSLQAKTLIIACKNAVIAQELILQKRIILGKITPYMEALHIKITDIKFDTKRWSEDY